jgi:hypothetical protein
MSGIFLAQDPYSVIKEIKDRLDTIDRYIKGYEDERNNLLFIYESIDTKLGNSEEGPTLGDWRKWLKYIKSKGEGK